MEKVRRDPASLSQLVKDFDLEVVYKGLDYDTRMITIPDVNRPALQLVGFYDYFEPKRLQILGKAEFTFLKAMPLEQRRKVFEDLLRCEIPALIVARNMEIFPELMEIARKHGRTLLRTEKTTVELTSHIIDYLNRALAPQITRHGVLMNIYGQGVLMIGDSGIGKSETAIELLKRGHRLGRIIREGSAIPNTGIPGVIGGYGAERVIHAQAAGVFMNVRKIGDLVEKGEVIATIRTPEGKDIPVTAQISGILRGLLRSGYPVTPGFKIADIDPRREELSNCFLISDKSRCIAGSVLELVCAQVWQ